MTSPSSDPPQVLPIVTVHPSFPYTISEVREGVIPSDTFWVSCYKKGESSVHGKVRIELPYAADGSGSDHVTLIGEDGVEMTEVNDTHGFSYKVSCSALAISSTPLGVPSQQYFDPEKADPRRPQRITSFDVAPDKSQFATGFLDGSVSIYPIAPTQSASIIPPSADSPYPSIASRPYASSKPHLSTVTALRFFPSSRVLLSAGADFALHILAAEVPAISSSSGQPARFTPARTLRGHTRTISGTAIVSRGRNIVSASLDGTARLWDVSSGQEIRKFGRGTVPIVALALGDRNGSFSRGVSGEQAVVNGASMAGEGGVDPREVETQDKLVACALQDGSFELFDLASGQLIFRSSITPMSPALTSIAYSPKDALVAIGSSRGVVSLYDLRALEDSEPGNLSPPSFLTSFVRNEAGIEDLSFAAISNTASDFPRRYLNTGLIIATNDGLPFIAELRPSESNSIEGSGAHSILANVARELVGADCDGVRCVCVVDGEIWSAGDDAIVRRYFL